MGNSVAAFDTVSDTTLCADGSGRICGEDPDQDIEAFARFMRATKAPPRDTALAATANAIAGSNLFNAIGCNICHVTSITTSAPGTSINGGALNVAAALGNKIIHPYGDFLLHDIGTGDGIVQNGGPATRNKLRTQPLWGVRTHDRHMHDGASLTFDAAIQRHAGEATFVQEQLQPADDDDHATNRPTARKAQLPKGQMPELGRPTKVGDELPLFNFDAYFPGTWTFEWDMPEGPLGPSGQVTGTTTVYKVIEARASSTRPTPTPPGPAARSRSTS